MVETCLARSQLASVVFGAIGGTVVICSAFAAILWYIFYKYRKGEKILVIERRSEEGHNEFDGVKGHKIFEKRPLSDDVPLSELSDHRSHEVQLVLQPKADRSVGNDHQSLFDSVGLEFGSGDDGIAINRVSDDLRHSNVRCGDTIRELAVSFDELTLTEAEALLALLASYKVTLKLRRTYNEEEPRDEVDVKTVPVESNPAQPTTTTTVQSPLPTTDKPVQAAEATADETMYEDETPEESSKPPTPPTVSPPSSRRASSDDSPNGKSPRSSRIPLAVASDGKPKPEPPAISRIWPPSPGMNRVRPLTTVDPPKKFDFNEATKKDVEDKVDGAKGAKLTDTKDILQREDSVVLGRMYEEIKEHLKHTFDEIAIADDKMKAEPDMPTVQLSDAQYATLESNRRRLERERQQLRDLGVLS